MSSSFLIKPLVEEICFKPLGNDFQIQDMFANKFHMIKGMLTAKFWAIWNCITQDDPLKSKELTAEAAGKFYVSKVWLKFDFELEKVFEIEIFQTCSRGKESITHSIELVFSIGF